MPVENQMSEGRYILVWVNTSRESRYHSEETDISREPCATVGKQILVESQNISRKPVTTVRK
jgi:hypothetical protein